MPDDAEDPDFKWRRPPVAYQAFPRFVAPDFLTQEEQVNFYLPKSSNASPNEKEELACSLIRSIDEDVSSDMNRLVKGKDFLFEIDSSRPVIVLCHGLSSWRNQVLFVWLAAHLSRALKCHTIRFDFTGSAHSSGPYQYTNYAGEVADVDEVVQFIQSTMGCQVVSVLGHSKGSHAAIRYAWEHSNDDKEPVATFVNLAGRFGVANDFDMKDHFSELQLDTFEYKGEVKVGRLGHRDMWFTQDDLEERLALTSSPAQDIRVPVLTIHGSADRELEPWHAHKFNEVLSNHELHIVEGADHNFNGLKHMDFLVDTIAAFLRKHCSDLFSIE